MRRSRMTDFTLIPYEGASPILFGMDPSQVKSILGEPESVKSLSDRVEEWRSHLIVTYEHDKVVEVTLAPGASLVYKGRNLFVDKDPIAFLMSEDAPVELAGSLLFLNLGLSESGFHDNDSSQRCLSVFQRGRMDRFKEHWKKYEQ
jgi:hypothetical protein